MKPLSLYFEKEKIEARVADVTCSVLSCGWHVASKAVMSSLLHHSVTDSRRIRNPHAPFLLHHRLRLLVLLLPLAIVKITFYTKFTANDQCVTTH